MTFKLHSLHDIIKVSPHKTKTENLNHCSSEKVFSDKNITYKIFIEWHLLLYITYETPI